MWRSVIAVGFNMSCNTLICEYPSADRNPPGLRRWTIDLCPQLVFTPRLRPAPDAHPDLEGTVGYKPDYFEWRSAHPARAMYESPHNNTEEPCKYHYGKTGVDERGRAIVAYCSRPYDDTQHKQNHRAKAIVVKATDVNVEVKPGYCAMLGRYHAPFWTEVDFRSQSLRCGGRIS